jgi:C-terminal processing protease CtpA/Prc
MRGFLAFCPALLASAVCAAPVPAPGSLDEPAGARPLEADARLFAQQLLRAADQVAAVYVRPVTREELLQTALTGLYEEARLPVPRDLRAKIQRAADKKAVKVETFELYLETPEPDHDLIVLLQHARENVGDAKPLRGRDPLVVCCEAMTRRLDPYSCVLQPAELRRTLAPDGEGFGLEVGDHAGSGPLIVKSVAPGGPAQRAGVRPGDEITHLDGKAVADLSRAELLRLLYQPADPPAEDPALPPGVVLPPPPPPPPGVVVPTPTVEPEPFRPIKATLRRAESKAPLTVDLAGEAFRPETVLGVRRRDDNSWDYLVDAKQKIAHIRIASVGKYTPSDLRNAVVRLRDDGLRGVILDLRWCPGGLLEEAVDSARLFLPEGVVARVKSRAKEEVVYRSTGEDAFTDFPMVVLVNGETMGGAELIAAALQDQGRAVVLGQRTVGKGSVQTSTSFGAPHVVLKLTSGAFVRPSGKNLQRNPDARPEDDWGVRPDDGLESRLSADLSRELKRDWQRQTLRPGACNDRLPLDDPDADPQRQAALEALRRKRK